MATTKLKLWWLRKRKNKYRIKAQNAFATVKKELIAFLNDYKGPIDALVKYLAKTTETQDLPTFNELIKNVIKEAKQCKGDPDAKRAIIICKYILFRLHYLSNFVLKWTNVQVKCKNCKRIVRTNFLYTDKICPYCGEIIL